MSRNLRESLAGGGRNVLAPGSVNHRRRQSFAGFSKETDENLDLFSKNRQSLSIASSDECSDVSLKLGRLSLGSAKLAKSAVDDLLSSTDGVKHDYDWLLTPPGTPIFPSSDGNESQTTKATSRSRSLVRSTSTTNTSRLSVSHSESNHSARPTRSSSVTRPSINRSSSILNTSSGSVSSYIRPSSPITRSSSTARPSSPSTRSTSSSSRSSTPSRARPVSTTSSSVDRPRSSSRPSTPSSRPQIPANLNSPAARSSSRSSTPTRRNLAAAFSAALGPSTSATYGLANGRKSAPSSRPSSPGPRVQPSQQPTVPPDFPLDTPTNLRTTLPDRPVSAGRSRPSAPLSSRGNPEPPGRVSVPRRQSSPVVTRGRVHSKGADAPEPRKTSHNLELVMLKLARTPTNPTDSSGFGRTITKKSLDMAVRHMDPRNGTCNNRPISGTTLFPQSIRSSTQKPQPARTVSSSGTPVASNGSDPENGNYISRACVDIYESSRYDSIFQKEDMKNTNWLHSGDNKSDDQVSIFGHGFEHLPEPFGML